MKHKEEKETDIVNKMKVSELKVGNYAILRRHPCQITEITSKPLDKHCHNSLQKS